MISRIILLFAIAALCTSEVIDCPAGLCSVGTYQNEPRKNISEALYEWDTLLTQYERCWNDHWLLTSYHCCKEYSDMYKSFKYFRELFDEEWNKYCG